MGRGRCSTLVNPYLKPFWTFTWIFMWTKRFIRRFMWTFRWKLLTCEGSYEASDKYFSLHEGSHEGSCEGSREGSPEGSYGATTDWRTLFQQPSRSALPISHAVPMVGLWPTPEPNHIFYWDYNRLIPRSGWSHALGGKTEIGQIDSFEPPDEHSHEPSCEKKVHMKLHMKLHMKVIFIWRFWMNLFLQLS